MLFPLDDDDREVSRTAFVTYMLLAINIIAFFVQQVDPAVTYGWSVIPYEITHRVDLVEPVEIERANEPSIQIPQAPGPAIIWLTLITSMFLHGDLMHLGGNMLYLWIFGDNVENRFGHLRFLIFYLGSGLVGSLAQIFMDPMSVIPNLGASGAISGIMGAYLVLFPHNQVKAIFFYQVVTVPALVVLGMWIIFQLISGVGSYAASSGALGGVAYMAHIGGFVAGVVFAMYDRTLLRSEPDSELYRHYRRDPKDRRWW